MPDTPEPSVRPFDPYSTAGLESGPRMFADFGKKCPVHHYEGRFDFYIASNYSDIKDKILLDHKVWSAKGGNTPRFIDPKFFSPISSDPPIHHEYRDVVRRGFSPDKMKLLSAHIERISNELIDAILAAPEPGCVKTSGKICRTRYWGGGQP